jgi:hypothetical protein
MRHQEFNGGENHISSWDPRQFQKRPALTSLPIATDGRETVQRHEARLRQRAAILDSQLSPRFSCTTTTAGSLSSTAGVQIATHFAVTMT